jgi:hypothetical protein
MRTTDHSVDPATHAVSERLKLETQFKSGANWFFWIAGMSLVNSVVGMFGGQWGFLIGLGITQVIDAALTTPEGDVGIRLLGPLLTAAVAGVFIACGHFAREGKRTAFITGMVLYVLDSLIFVLVRDFLAVALHAVALFFLMKGMHAKDQLDQLPQPRTAPAGGVTLGG